MILMIDDNPGDPELMCLALAEAEVHTEVSIAINGLHGQELLLAAIDSGASYQLVLLDLNMPLMDGRAFLGWARSRRDLRDLPMVMLTSSHSPADQRDCLALGATDYLIKPFDFDGYQILIEALKPYLDDQSHQRRQQ